VPSEVDPRLLEEMWRSQRRFGHIAARLYPLVDRKVRTEEGQGTLWQVLGGRAGVVLDKDPQKVTFVSVESVKPLKQHVSTSA
jgi:hypothetical protein